MMNTNATTIKMETAAAPIPLPTSHIHRTHSELQFVQDEILADYQDGQMYERICKSAHPSTLYDNHQCDFHLCYIVNHDLILRLSADSVIGILRRCGEMGTCHPKTSSSLENIMNTKMQDCRSISERRTSDADNNWVVGEDLSEPIRRSFHERGLTRHKDNFTSLLSNKLESETTNSSMSSLSCSASHMDDSDDATDDIESGIFELEL